jgi:hypothetical protein
MSFVFQSDRAKSNLTNPPAFDFVTRAHALDRVSRFVTEQSEGMAFSGYSPDDIELRWLHHHDFLFNRGRFGRGGRRHLEWLRRPA